MLGDPANSAASSQARATQMRSAASERAARALLGQAPEVIEEECAAPVVGEDGSTIRRKEGEFLRVSPVSLMPQQTSRFGLQRATIPPGTRLAELCDRAEQCGNRGISLSAQELALAPTWAHGLARLLSSQVGPDSHDLDGHWWRMRRAEIALSRALAAQSGPHGTQADEEDNGALRWEVPYRNTPAQDQPIMIALRRGKARSAPESMSKGKLLRGWGVLGVRYPGLLLDLKRLGQRIDLSPEEAAALGLYWLPPGQWKAREHVESHRYNPVALAHWDGETGAGSMPVTQAWIDWSGYDLVIGVNVEGEAYSLKFESVDLLVVTTERVPSTEEELQLRLGHEQSLRVYRSLYSSVREAALHPLMSLGGGQELYQRPGGHYELRTEHEEDWSWSPRQSGREPVTARERLPWPVRLREDLNYLKLMDDAGEPLSSSEQLISQGRRGITLVAEQRQLLVDGCAAIIQDSPDPQWRALARRVAERHGIDTRGWIEREDEPGQRLPLLGPYDLAVPQDQDDPRVARTVDAHAARILGLIAAQIETPEPLTQNAAYLLLSTASGEDRRMMSGWSEARQDARFLHLMPVKGPYVELRAIQTEAEDEDELDQAWALSQEARWIIPLRGDPRLEQWQQSPASAWADAGGEESSAVQEA